ncbi:MAG: mycofactocin system transcriptional regulator [Mycobacteriaceae bacterium]
MTPQIGAPRAGRRPSTTRAEIGQVGLDLFAANGFEATTVEQLSAAAGISRRTLFRYFDSKNDVPWGEFDAELHRMREFLHALPADAPLGAGLVQALVDFNTVTPEQTQRHRLRMRLLLTVPALQAHATLKYAEWLRAVAEHVAHRTGCRPDEQGPRTTAWMALGVALAAYERWLDDEGADLGDLLRTGGRLLTDGITAPH